MTNSGFARLLIAAASSSAVLLGASSAGAVTGLYCHSIGQHLTNGHCCPEGEVWGSGSSQMPAKCFGTGHFGQPFNPGSTYTDDFSGALTNPCKKLHTC